VSRGDAVGPAWPSAQNNSTKVVQTRLTSPRKARTTVLGLSSGTAVPGLPYYQEFVLVEDVCVVVESLLGHGGV
jgi:hypothetical protein